MTNDENRFLLAAKEAISKANCTIDQVAKTFGFYLAEPRVLIAPVNQVVLSRDEKDALLRHLRNLGYRCRLTDIHPSTDGLNHYNIYSQARTTLCKMASNFYSRPNGGYFVTPDGSFLTLEGYYHYLRILDYAIHTYHPKTDLTPYLDVYDTIRSAMRHMLKAYPDIALLAKSEGADCIRIGRALKATIYGGTKYRPGAFSPLASGRFMSAMVFKLHLLKIDGVCIGNLLAAQVHHDVPFYHYYVSDKGQITPPHAEWLPDIITQIVEHIDPYGKTFDVGDVAYLTGIENGAI